MPAQTRYTLGIKGASAVVSAKEKEKHEVQYVVQCFWKCLAFFLLETQFLICIIITNYYFCILNLEHCLCYP